MTSTPIDRGRIHHGLSNGLYLRETQPGEPSDTLRGTLLYIHGLGESGLCFEGLLAEPRLAEWRQVTLDLPGYGKTPWPDQPLSLPDFAERLAEWIEADLETAPGGTTPVLAGHSMGGVIGALLVETLASRGLKARGFLNIEGNVSLADCGFSSRADAHTRESFVARGYDELLDGLWADGAEDQAIRVYYPSARICDPRTYHLNSTELVERSRHETLATQYAGLGIPTLYVLGNPRGTGAKSRQLLDAAGVPWHAVEEAGHWPFLDQPERFLDTAVSFLSGLGKS